MRARLFLLSFPLALLASVAATQMPESGGHNVSGFVREEGSQAPVQQVALEITSSGQRAAHTAYSNMEGEFSFGPVKDGEYYVVAKKDGYVETTVHVSVSPAGVQALFISLPKVRSGDVPTAKDAVSLRQLSIPQKARDTFDRGRKLLYEKSDATGAIKEFQKAIKEFPAYYEAYTQIGVADYRLKDPGTAEDALRKAIELSENKYPESLYLLAGLLNDQQRFLEAVPVARRAAELDESSWNAYFELARALVGIKRGAPAEVCALKALQLEPTASRRIWCWRMRTCCNRSMPRN